ncbi:MAG: rod shape-determining protein MreD [Firmicutes bacterium]|jgi:rod shape-determining protein MreD|nr:rod shape-determining protein MreD [Bacillota bacterium]HPU01440.1 rod shape-determining protein MreD [Bacillota bacterium]
MIFFYVLVSISFVLALLVEGSVFSFFIVEQALPDIFLVMVVSLGFILDERRGAAIGLCAGLLQDVIFSKALGFFALAKMLLGYGAGLLGRELYREQLLAPVLLVFVGTLTHEFILHLLVSQFIGFGLPVEMSLSRLFIPKAFYNMALTLLIYPLFYRAYHRRRQIRSSFSRQKGAMR